ncbi:hypothetical protein OTU49_003069 [Cherax quadricarinatus]|uniref:CD80-like immunoglobulin C2-set domain-containing protein n=1 Tax=Cherax quadricarinatus TaxID=27406 RepID=A0AAW0XJJ1_CHEQU|nr:uncharacterized protein LOC128693741 [Cherax quadricarinatus]
MSFSLTSLFLHLLFLQGVSLAIRISQLEVPTLLAVGEGGWLVCDWDDEGDHVYSLKWYLGIDEFYRWTPLETPSVKTFPMQHFRVDTRASQRGRVRIHNVTVNAGGNYQCEVSGEAPVFKTSVKSSIMTVVDLPDERPTITGEEEGPFKLQQQVTFTCFSQNARPAPSLSFYINNQTVDPSWEEGVLVHVNKTTTLETAFKTLRFHLRPNMVHMGVLQVKCAASYPELYWESSERVFTVDLPYNHAYQPDSQGFMTHSGDNFRATPHTPLIYSLPLVLSILFSYSLYHC